MEDASVDAIQLVWMVSAFGNQKTTYSRIPHSSSTGRRQPVEDEWAQWGDTSDYQTCSPSTQGRMGSYFVIKNASGERIPKLDQIEMSEAIRNVFHDLGNPLPGTIGEKLVLQGRKEGLDEGRKAGLEAGREAGLLAGKIELIQQLFGVPVLSRKRLLNLSGDEMSSLLEELQMTLREQGRH